MISCKSKEMKLSKQEINNRLVESFIMPGLRELFNRTNLSDLLEVNTNKIKIGD